MTPVPESMVHPARLERIQAEREAKAAEVYREAVRAHSGRFAQAGDSVARLLVWADRAGVGDDGRLPSCSLEWDGDGWTVRVSDGDYRRHAQARDRDLPVAVARVEQQLADPSIQLAEERAEAVSALSHLFHCGPDRAREILAAVEDTIRAG